MPLTLYRRHGTSCKVHDLGLPAKAIRHYLECECPIWIVGKTDTTEVPRQATGLTDLKAAEALLRSMSADAKDEKVHGLKLADCIEKYLHSREHELGAKTIGQHKLLLGRLSDYAASRNVFFAQELNVDLLEDFKVYGLPGMADTSKSTSVAKLRCFLKDAYRRGWIKEALVQKVKTHKAVYEQKQPYSDKEVEAILEWAGKLNGGINGYAAYPNTLRLLIELMLETGMRVGDAIRYDPMKTVKSEHLWVYTFVPQKTRKTEKQKPVEAYLSDRLKKAIDDTKWMSNKFPFAYRPLTDTSYMANEVYERMKAIGSRCGVTDCRPHRLRDTAAVRWLLRGIALEDVSRLLGHSSVAITEKYYAAWTAGRKLRLEKLLAESLVNS